MLDNVYGWWYIVYVPHRAYKNKPKGCTKMTVQEFANKILSLPISKQNEFFESLKKELSQEDWETTVKFIALHSMFCDVQKYEAIKNAIRDQMCEDIYGHIVEPQNKKDISCNPPYMTTIL